MIRWEFFTFLYLSGCSVSSSKNGAIKANQHLSVCIQTRSHAAEKKILPVLPPEFLLPALFYKITDHTCNPKTNFRKLDQKIHSCYFQNMT